MQPGGVTINREISPGLYKKQRHSSKDRASITVTNIHKTKLLDQLQGRFGELHALPGSQSLFAIGNNAARVYLRYSRVHDRGRTFFGLREVDLRQLEGHNSFLCFLLDDGSAPLFIPYADFEEIFHAAEPARDGQFKVQLISSTQSRELYIARQGRFNVEGYMGMGVLERGLTAERLRAHRSLTHPQVQTLLAGIGHKKGYSVRVPEPDIDRLDWTLTDRFRLTEDLPAGFTEVKNILAEIDVLWITSGSNTVEAVFEVEHSTPVYSGLLRFNDLLLAAPKLSRFCIVSNDSRRTVFSRQVYRPTFKKSGLAEIVSFLEYPNVFDWHERLTKGGIGDEE